MFKTVGVAGSNRESTEAIIQFEQKPLIVKKVRPPSADYNGRNRVIKRSTTSDIGISKGSTVVQIQ